MARSRVTTAAISENRGAPVSVEHAVYAGRVLLGSVSGRTGRYQALDANGKLIGTFAKHPEAIQAVRSTAGVAHQ
jgi:hypothetical protein